MKIELMLAPTNPIDIISMIGGICYDKEDTETHEKRFKHLLDHGHHSVFEHIQYTFKIEGISRACLAQLTRHRHASFTVRSQRYCNEAERDYIMPEEVGNKHLEDYYNSIIKNLNISYNYLIQQGIKKEDARMILPQAITTDLYMSCNLRELIHIHTLRTGKGAQEEIKDLVTEMVGQVLEISPELSIAFRKEDEGGK